MTVGNGSLRFFGFLSNTNKRWALKTIRTSLGMQPPPEPTADEPKAASEAQIISEGNRATPGSTTAEKILRLTGLNVARCPKCEGKLIACPLPLLKHPP